ncbi:putative transcription regulator mTERF family [Rosa chinensis]|uniref:Putative transcription regulator mTERF family n=1 Tax=Rosa chinensis TaxID=74649 RepID=A0A2P6RYB8_ROSCH|nr:putative transcription regulator mTERF family [Rosa chinensis]
MKVRFDTPEKPDSVIKLFKDYGLSDAHISDIVKKCPVLLVSNAEKTLWPKLQFFTSIGLSGNDLARIFRVNLRYLDIELREKY